MFKFLHAADIHLDSPLRGLDRYEGCPSGEIRGATRRALDNLVRLAIEEGVAFVLIAGDVYDGDWKDHNTGLWFVKRMADLRDAGIKVFLIRGNHDAQNRMTRDLRLPDNVVSLNVDRPQTCYHDDLPVAVHGQGFATQSVKDDLAAQYPAADPGCFNVGMLHTSATGRQGHHDYAPCTVEALRAKGYGYWALGHVHTREVLDEREAAIVFPGNIQGRHIREAGPKGCMLVSVEGHRVAAREFRPLDVLRWETCRVDASEATDGDDVLRAFRDRLPGLLAEADDRFLALRVEVSGASAAHDKLASDMEGWSFEIRSLANTEGSNRIWVEAVKLRTRPLRIGGDAGDGPLAELDRLLAELRGDDRLLKEFAGRELAELRKKVPAELRREDGVDLDAPDWLRGVLDQVRPLLKERFELAGRVR
jgi:DNA repair protein SbcD/Mre11